MFRPLPFVLVLACADGTTSPPTTPPAAEQRWVATVTDTTASELHLVERVELVLAVDGAATFVVEGVVETPGVGASVERTERFGAWTAGPAVHFDGVDVVGGYAPAFDLSCTATADTLACDADGYAISFTPAPEDPPFTGWTLAETVFEGATTAYPIVETVDVEGRAYASTISATVAFAEDGTVEEAVTQRLVGPDDTYAASDVYYGAWVEDAGQIVATFAEDTADMTCTEGATLECLSADGSTASSWTR